MTFDAYLVHVNYRDPSEGEIAEFNKIHEHDLREEKQDLIMQDYMKYVEKFGASTGPIGKSEEESE